MFPENTSGCRTSIVTATQTWLSGWKPYLLLLMVTITLTPSNKDLLCTGGNGIAGVPVAGHDNTSCAVARRCKKENLCIAFSQRTSRATGVKLYAEKSDQKEMMVFKLSIFFFLVIVLCSVLTDAVNPSISLVKASFKLNVVRDGEKIHQVWLTAEPDTVSQIASPDGFHADIGNSLSIQASFADSKGEPTFVRQLFLRIMNQRTKQDNLFLVKRKGRDMRVDVVLKNEVKSDAEFWTIDDSYAVTLVMGDLHLKESATWTITENVRFADGAMSMFTRPKRGVFDFDVGVKKGLLPEFVAPVPTPEKRAPLVAIVIALVSVLLPLPLLLITWGRLGVFPLVFPKEKSQQLSIFGFEACLLGHLACLVMFWVKWNIVTTWKYVGALMIPTVVFGRNILASDKEER